MVDSIVSTVVERLTSAIIGNAEEEVKLVLGAKKDVEKLKSKFRAIKAVLADANQRQFKEASVRYWIDNLKDVSYDIDDVLDEWSTKIQMQTFLCCLRKYVKEIFLRRDIAVKIKELNSRLDLIASQRNTYQLREISSNENPPPRPQTISAIDVTEVKGRDEDKQKVISMLMAKSSKKPSLPVVSIVGVGGIGKSTLAQLVFNDPKVKVYFDYKRIWVHVSNPFDEIKVANAILESLTEKGSDYMVLETITQKMQEIIENKCFLLVLDDVWSEDPEKWKPIKTSLLGGSPNSRILVTTRKEKVASLMGCTEYDMIRLGELSTEDSCSLFSQLTFSCWTNRERQHLDLEETGRQLVAKCHGLPLAIKSLGIHLSTCKSRPKWLSVLGSEKWVEVAETSLLPSLWFSYNDLTSELKQCFSYCSIFPKGYKIEKYKLIEQWMAQGYLSSRRGEDEEMVGEDYFEDLAARSFFQNFEKDENDGSIVACRMHDMVHDLAQYIASAECRHVKVQSSVNDVIKMDCSSPIQPRHSNIVVSDQTLLFAQFDNLKKLRTLFVQTESQLKLEPTALNDLFSKLNCLTSLYLSFCAGEEIPSSISCLMHLRWLDLSDNNDLEELPEALCELHNLQTLDIRGCSGMRKLPQGIGKLVKLKHLHNYDCFAPTPKGIRRLRSLRTLEVFKVGNDGEAATLGDLKTLKNIQGRLAIFGLGDATDLDEANQVQLKERDLSMLELHFSGSENHDQKVLEALEPPPSLTKLEIFYYQGRSLFSNWLLSLTSLRKLKLTNCKRCEHLPPLGKLKHLEHIRIGGFDEVEKVGVEFLGLETLYEEDDHTHELEIFPKLAKLEFWGLRKWEAWNNINSIRNVAVMPLLRYPRLHCCPKLEALPDYVLQHPTLEEVEITFCNILQEKHPEKKKKAKNLLTFPKGAFWIHRS